MHAPYRVTEGLASSLILSYILAWSMLVVSATWICTCAWCNMTLQLVQCIWHSYHIVYSATDIHTQGNHSLAQPACNLSGCYIDPRCYCSCHDIMQPKISLDKYFAQPCLPVHVYIYRSFMYLLPVIHVSLVYQRELSCYIRFYSPGCPWLVPLNSKAAKV